MAVKSRAKDGGKKPKKATLVIKRSQGYKYDWDAIRTQYIEGVIIVDKNGKKTEDREWTTLKALSEKLNVPYDRLRERSSVESWKENREAYQMRLARTRQSQRIQKLGKESVDFDDKTLNVAKTGMTLIQIRLGEIANDVSAQQERRRIALEQQAQGFDIDPKDLRSSIWAREMDELARAASSFQQIGAKALGTDVIKHELQVEASMDIDIAITSISSELGRDDPERLAAFIYAVNKSKLGQTEIVKESGQIDDPLQITDENIRDAEIIEDIESPNNNLGVISPY